MLMLLKQRLNELNLIEKFLVYFTKIKSNLILILNRILLWC